MCRISLNISSNFARVVIGNCTYCWLYTSRSDKESSEVGFRNTWVTKDFIFSLEGRHTCHKGALIGDRAPVFSRLVLLFAYSTYYMSASCRSRCET